MTFTFSILVVANRTADSDELLEALTAHAARRPTRFTLLVPAPAPGPEGKEAARGVIDRALERTREAGLEVDAKVGNTDPFSAVGEAWDPKAFDEVIVSTLPGAASKWLQVDLPHRIARMTDAQVTHVVASDRRDPDTQVVTAPDKKGLFSPLSVLTWGGKTPKGE